MFSFTRGKPIARIEGGEHDGKTLHLYDPNITYKCCDKCSPKCEKKKHKCCKKCKFIKDDGIGVEAEKFIDDNFLLKRHGNRTFMKKMKYKELQDIINSIINKKMPENEEYQKIYKDGVDLLESKKNVELKLNDGKLIPLPNNVLTEEGERVYIAAPSGAGKTTYARNYIKEFKRMFPKIKDLIVFSRSTEDKALDDLKPMRIKLDEDLVNNPIEIESLSNSIVLFDDVDTIQNKKVKDAVISLRDDINQCGRKYNIYCISTAHQLTNYKSSRELLNESNSVTFFPRSGSAYGIKYFLKNYCGLGKNEIEKIMSLPSRWITIVKRYPNYVLYENGAYLLYDSNKSKTEEKKEKKKDD